MTFERRDWVWIVGMTVVGSCFFDKRPWSEPGAIETSIWFGLMGACLGLLISRLTRRAASVKEPKT